MPKPKSVAERKDKSKGNPLHDKRMRTLTQRVKVPTTPTKTAGGIRLCEGITAAGKRCHGWATRGNVFCAYHGGAAKHEPGIGSFQHPRKPRTTITRDTRLYLNTLNTQEQVMFDGILEKLEVKPELSLLRTKLNSMLEKYGEDWTPTRKQMDFMVRTIERLSLIAERIKRTVEGYRIKVTVDKQAMEDLFNVCKEFVPQDKWADLATKLVATADAASGRTASTEQP
jgi:hypothetical protein